MTVLPKSTRLGNRLDLRFESENVSLGENIVFDDDVRVVVPPNGRLTVGDNVKFGKGTILNCGGTVVIGNNVSFYGYCYIQSSKWVWADDEKKYSYNEIQIGDRASLAPQTTVAGNSVVPVDYRSRPGEAIGEW